MLLFKTSWSFCSFLFFEVEKTRNQQFQNHCQVRNCMIISFSRHPPSPIPPQPPHLNRQWVACGVAGDVGSLCWGGPGHHSAERAHRTPGAHRHHIRVRGEQSSHFLKRQSGDKFFLIFPLFDWTYYWKTVHAFLYDFSSVVCMIFEVLFPLETKSRLKSSLKETILASL
jgi:hypothetical protein